MNIYQDNMDKQWTSDQNQTINNINDDENKINMNNDEDEQIGKNRGGRKQMKIGTNRRNARERNRVQHLNACFEILRQHIPHQKHQKKLSKVDTLKSAMIYIENLRQLLENSSQFSSRSSSIYFDYSDDSKSYFPLDIKKEEQCPYWSDQHQL